MKDNGTDDQLSVKLAQRYDPSVDGGGARLRTHRYGSRPLSIQVTGHYCVIETNVAESFVGLDASV